MSKGVDLVALYRRQYQRCKTPNQLNRLLITLENRMTPLEYAGIREMLPTKLHETNPTFEAFLTWFYVRIHKKISKRLSRFRAKLPRFMRGKLADSDIERTAFAWRRRIDLFIGFAGKPVPEPFVRQRIGREIGLYEGPGNRADKTLIIAFGGGAHRIMMPISVFLQHVDATRVSVALLRDPKQEGFRDGIWGIAPTILGLVEQLPAILKTSDYRSVVVLGTSGGGLPAILTGMTLGTKAAVSVGGNGPDDPRWNGSGGAGRTIGETLVSLREGPGKDTRIYMLYGADYARDRVKAVATHALIGGELVEVSDPANPKIGHASIFAIARQGKLTEFLQQTLLAE